MFAVNYDSASDRLVRFRAALAAIVLGVTIAGCSDVPEHPTGPPLTPAVTGSVWVADEDGDSLTVVDAATNTVLTTLTGLHQPHNVQVGLDGAIVYALSGSDNVVVAIDPATYKVTAIAPTGPAPAHVIEAPNGTVYVTNSGDGTVSVYDGPGLSQTGRITVGGMPHGLRPAGNGSVIVVANTDAGALDVIDSATNAVVGRVNVGSGPAQVAVGTDGRYAYAGINKPSAVVKVDLVARKLVGSVPVPSQPVQLYLTPDDAILVSANQGTQDKPGNTASLIDTATMTVRSTVNAGSGPHGVTIDDTGTWAWITNSYDNTTTAIDIPTSSARATIQTGARPNGISYSPRSVTPSGPTVTLTIPALPASIQAPSGGHHGH